eukprot:3052503-Rhodomonas_salina.3
MGARFPLQWPGESEGGREGGREIETRERERERERESDTEHVIRPAPTLKVTATSIAMSLSYQHTASQYQTSQRHTSMPLLSTRHRNAILCISTACRIASA